MSRIILLSSSDEDTTDEPPRKRIKPTLIVPIIKTLKPVKTVNKLNADAVIISSDEESVEHYHHNNFLSPANSCKIENTEEQNDAKASELKDHDSLSTDICFDVSNTTLENDPSDQCSTVDNCLEDLPTSTPLECINQLRIENVFTTRAEDSLPISFHDESHIECVNNIRIDNVFTSHEESNLSTSVQDVSDIETAKKRKRNNVFNSHAGDCLSTPLQLGNHVESVNKIRIDNVFTSYAGDTLIQDKSRLNDSFSTHSGNPLEDTLHTSAKPDNSPQEPQAESIPIPQSSLEISSPCGYKSEDKSKSENKISAETTPSPDDNETTVDEMDAFLKTCSRSVKRTKYESLRERFSTLNELYQKYILNKGYNDEVGAYLAEHITEAAKSPSDAVLVFSEVLEYFKAATIEEVEIPPEYRKKVKMLGKTCLKLIHKIKQLESAEVNWDDDENSAYIQEDRYKKRLVKVFNLYCKCVKQNPYQGRLTHKKLNFTASNYKEINAAVIKNCQKHDKFPSYKDVEHIVRKCVKRFDLPLSASKIQRESEKCFKIVGRFLQKRRKQELYESHFYFIKDSNDPASIDRQLDKCLKQNFAEGMKKIEMICEKYAERQMEQSQIQQSEDDTASESSSDEESDTS